MILKDIVAKYDTVSIDEISFNDVTYELEIDLWWLDGDKSEFVKDCNSIKKEMEFFGFECTYDDVYSEHIYRLYIIL